MNGRVVVSKMTLLVVTAVATWFGGGQQATAWAGPITKPVFVSGAEGYHTYRIPSVIVTRKGTVLAFCEGRKSGRGDAGNIDVVLKRSFDHGETWQPLQTVWDDGGHTCGNPCPVVDRDTGTIWLLLTHNLGEDKESQIIDGTSKGSRTCWVCRSTDDGATWTKPVEITRDVKPADWTWYATGPGVGIQLKSGRLVIPCDNKVAVTKGRQSHVIFSDDHGTTWKLGGVVGPNCNESQIVELSDGSLHLNMRTYRANNRRLVAISKDQGVTFSAPVEDQKLIEPVCQASILRYDSPTDLRVPPILFSNPASTKRENMTVRLSLDDGRSWSHDKQLFAGPAAYSCLTVLADHRVACLYECGEKSAYDRIDFTRFTLAWLQGKENMTDASHGSRGSAGSTAEKKSFTVRSLAELPKPLTSFGAAAVGEHVFVHGGHFGKAHHYSDAGQSGDLLRLSLTADKSNWETLASASRTQGHALVAHGGKLYRVGGFAARNKETEEQNLWSSADFASFDPTSKQWSELAPMPEPRSSFDAVVLGDWLYVAGGWNMAGAEKTTWSQTAYRADLSQPQPAWKPLAPPPFQRRALSLGVSGQRVLVIGGMQPEGKVTTRTAFYDPAKNEWQEGPALPGEEMEGFGSACCQLAGRTYVSTSSGKLLRLSADEKSWEPVQSLAAGRFFHRMLSVGKDELLLIGGASMRAGKFASCDLVRVEN